MEIEYVGETPVLDEEDPNFKYFTSVFGAFSVGRLFMQFIVVYRLEAMLIKRSSQ